MIHQELITFTTMYHQDGERDPTGFFRILGRSAVLSPMHLRTLAIGKCSIGESLIGEMQESQIVE